MAAEGPLTGISTIRATDAAQTRTAYQKIKAILAAKSDHLRDVVRPVAYLADMRDKHPNNVGHSAGHEKSCLADVVVEVQATAIIAI
jgi:enamine deaminase RidA (YjgF/YER057c/UK114 family)